MLVRLRLLAVVLCTAVGVSSPAVAQTLAWDRNPETNVTGYVVSYGTQPGVYTNRLDVGNVTSFPPSALDASLNYYFMVQAYNQAGEYSDYSAEVLLPAAVPPGTTVINSLTTTSTYPLRVGQSTTWTASAVSKAGPVEYAFFLLTEGVGWQQVQAFSTSRSWTWTPSWDDRGQHMVQVWARTVGSPARYEAWVVTEAFAVNTLPLQLSANTDFPVPPSQPVTWSAAFSGGSTSTPLEYRFWAFNAATGSWAVIQDYSSTATTTWVPATTGQYSFQVWVRRVGSTAAYDIYAAAGPVTVSRGPVTVTSLTSDRTCPCDAGDPMTWTARANGGTAGPLEYTFWRFREGSGWSQVQTYSTAKTYTWTPAFGDAGNYSMQVWVRSAGSTAQYDGWVSGTPFAVRQPELGLTTSTLFPVAPNTNVTFTAALAGNPPSIQYSFWVYTQATGTWSNLQPYSTANTFNWPPAVSGTYAVQAWARRIGSTVQYEAWKGTALLTISNGPAEVVSLTPSAPLPATLGTPVVWTAVGRGGTSAPLLYQFWVFNNSTGWVMVRDYSSSNTFTWTPSATGQHALQVWVKSTGSTVPRLEGWLGSGFFQVQ